MQTLHRHGHTAYFAGGCVRDRLLGIPAKDFDITTDARTVEIRKIFSQTIPVGAQFGVILVVLEGVPYEVATFRADGAYHDGRHPVAVRFSTAREDALRRDFTINGMFFDPLTDTVIDYVDGQADAQPDQSGHWEADGAFSRGPHTPAASRPLCRPAGLRY